MRDFVLIILAIVVIGGGYAVQAVQLYQAEGRAAALEQALATAQKDAAQWRAVAEQRAGAANAQAGLAEACLQREAVNQRDMDQIAAIMAGVKSTEGPAEVRLQSRPETATGVDNATRRAAAEYLNRPW